MLRRYVSTAAVEIGFGHGWPLSATVNFLLFTFLLACLAWLCLELEKSRFDQNSTSALELLVPWLLPCSLEFGYVGQRGNLQHDEVFSHCQHFD